MEKKELIEKLVALHETKDPEWAHGSADTLLIEYINDPEIAAAYDKIHKWYA